jgi:hypothetical protein
MCLVDLGTLAECRFEMKKVTCKDVARELTNYMEGRLSTRRHAEIESHIGSCRNCKTLLDTTEKMLRLVGNVEAFGNAIAAFEQMKAL